ncbi:hypothetical protein GPECTOR_12g447 [Gonium pectorale]|uniref:Uncharacterized protein n=1 Tax=Gonium pectorale TaxID=33097 RepID=A0A150GNU7_GONPE|nr:hypothetical protein GPECTOR_12g447 [Gonium pectorale]|eukprot:KXZ51484.1 hypothetical protein GPECTOR_12g447 [Gonium pectorale]
MTIQLGCRGPEASINLCPGYGWDASVNATCLSGRNDQPPGTPGRAIAINCHAPQNGTANAYNHPSAGAGAGPAGAGPSPGSAARAAPHAWLLPLLLSLAAAVLAASA